MWHKRELKLFIGGYFMICAEFERSEVTAGFITLIVLSVTKTIDWK